MYVCVVTEMTNLGEILYFLLDTVVNVLCYTLLKQKYGLIINSNVKCIFCPKKHIWVYWAHFETFANQLQINETYSYLVKITIEKIDICAIQLLNSQKKKLEHIGHVSVDYSKLNSLNSNLNEISMFIVYSNQVPSYSWSVVISNIWSPFQTVLFWKICSECN